MRCAWVYLVALAWLAPAARAGEVDFDRQIVPVLVRHCAGCHNASEPSGGLDLTKRAAAIAGGESGSQAIAPGNVEASYLVARLRAGEMPPQGKGEPVGAEEVARLEAWIASGATWPDDRVLSPFEFTTASRAGYDWWSLRAPERGELPHVADATRARTPIDAFVLARLEAAGLCLSEDADRATLIRRATFDLLGLPPTPEEVERFVTDPAPDAYERLVDRLLASPRYGERWARHWLDVVRFAESNGYETNVERPNAWPYRDWVIKALNDDIDYRRFILLQLAGDQFGADAATGFLVGGAHDMVESPDIELTLQQRIDDLDDMISTTGGAFLGLTVGCAKCHDHKFDPITQRDYYQLQAVFAGIRHGERELITPDAIQNKRQADELRDRLAEVRRAADALWQRHQPLARVGTPAEGEPRPAVRSTINVDRFAPVEARMVRFTVLATNQSEPCLDELEAFAADEPERNVALAERGAKATASSVYAGGMTDLHKLAHVHDGQYGNSRSWISAEPAGGWVQIEWLQPVAIDRVVWGRDREGTYHDRVSVQYRIEVGTTGNDWQTVAVADDRRPYTGARAEQEEYPLDGLPVDVAHQLQQYLDEADSLSKRLDQLAPRMVYAGRFAEPDETYVLYRGEPMQKRERIGPGAIRAVGDSLSLALDAPENERRVALARWIGSAANPLAARVIVNRLWHNHFGSGLVKTPSDFGWGGGQPSHPELLDWLATEFAAGGWRLKALHRAIMLSSVYRQASTPNEKAATIDAEGRLYWRYTPRRLDAESIRDAVLATSGVLDLRMGGPGYDVFQPNDNYVKVYTPKTRFTPAEWRRMVYQNKPRLRDDATFGAFDCPDASQPVPRRNVSTTALQALNLLNAPFMVEQAERFADRLEREDTENVDRQIDLAFRLAFSRPPDAAERNAARGLIDEHGLVAFCRAIFNANEFLYID